MAAISSTWTWIHNSTSVSIPAPRLRLASLCLSPSNSYWIQQTQHKLQDFPSFSLIIRSLRGLWQLQTRCGLSISSVEGEKSCWEEKGRKRGICFHCDVVKPQSDHKGILTPVTEKAFNANLVSFLFDLTVSASHRPVVTRANRRP